MLKISPDNTVLISKFTNPFSPSSFASGAAILPISRKEIFSALPFAFKSIFSISIFEVRFTFAALVFRIASLSSKIFFPFHSNGNLKLNGIFITLPLGTETTPEAVNKSSFVNKSSLFFTKTLP